MRDAIIKDVELENVLYCMYEEGMCLWKQPGLHSGQGAGLAPLVSALTTPPIWTHQLTDFRVITTNLTGNLHTQWLWFLEFCKSTAFRAEQETQGRNLSLQ